jgi:hypothetical protein
LLGNGSVNSPRGNEYTRNNGRAIERGVFYVVRIVSNTQYAVKGFFFAISTLNKSTGGGKTGLPPAQLAPPASLILIHDFSDKSS